MLGLDPERFGLSFTVMLHLGTLLAVLLYFARTWVELVRDLFRGRLDLLVPLVVGTVPAVVAGLLLQSAVESELRDPRLIALALVAGSVVFVFAERLGAGRRERVSVADAILMGVAQAIALLPGVSRSGITISAGLMAGLRREDATRFTFLLSTPVILGAAAKTLLDARRALDLFAYPDVLAVGLVVSFVSGLAAVAFMLRFLRGHSLSWFVPYRLLLAAAIVVAMAL